MLVFAEEGNWKTYKYHLRKDRWQSSRAMHPLPLAKIGGGGGKAPPPFKFRLSKGFEPVSLRYRWMHYYQLSYEIKPLLRSKGEGRKGLQSLHLPPPPKKKKKKRETAGI